MNGFLKSENWSDCADFFKAPNDWFNLFNSKIKYGKTIQSSAYGVDLVNQNKILRKMSSYMQNIRVGQHKIFSRFKKTAS